MKISTKILLPLLGILALGFFVSAWLTYNVSSAAFNQASASSQKMAIDNAIVELQNKVEFDLLNAISLAQTSLLQPYILGTPSERQANEKDAQDRITNMRNTYSYVFLGILDINGNVLRHTEDGHVGTKLADMAFFVEAMTGKTAISDPFIYNGTILYAVASPVFRTGTKEVIAVVYNASRLGDTMSERMHLGEKGYLMVTDSEGRIFIHKNIDSIFGYDINQVWWGREMLESQRGQISFEENEEAKLAYYDTMFSTGWLVAAVTDIAELNAPSIKIRDNGLIANLVILLFLAFIVYTCIDTVIKGLLKAIKYAENIAEGNLDDHLDVYQDDEIGNLSNSLRNMVKTLKEKIQEANTQTEIANKKEQEALIAMQTAEEATKIKSQFLASMSHEIRTPINSILGLSGLLCIANLEETNLKHAKNIYQSSSLLLKIINDLLDISKLEAGKIELIPTHYLLSQQMGHVSTIALGLAQSKNIEYHYIANENEDLCLYGDDIRLRQILINLLSNAIKFTEKGVVSLTIDTDEDSLWFVVKDSGIGIKQGEIEKIFNSFHQTDKLKNRTIQGTGLGLTICRSLATLMDGSITAESEYGKGSTFTLTIPKKLGKKTLIVQENAQMSFTTKDVHVLIVDDMEINLYVAKALLESYKIHCVTVTSGAKALEILKETSFDFVFMDYYMPEMDGLETTLAIRELGPEFIDLPVIALTANAMPEDKARCEAATMNDFLSKPIERKKLHSILEHWIPSKKRIYE